MIKIKFHNYIYVELSFNCLSLSLSVPVKCCGLGPESHLNSVRRSFIEFVRRDNFSPSQ